MRSKLLWPLASLAGAAGLVAAPAAAPTAVAKPATAPAIAPVTAAGFQPVLLINGTRLASVAGPGSRPTTMVLPSPGSSPPGLAMVRMGVAGHAADIPADALPFLGHGLDPSLFDLAALGRAEHGGQLPVRISYLGRVPALPGVRITRVAAGTADGYLTAQSATVFGAALRRQELADRATGSYGTDGMFAHGVSVALAGALVAHRVRPQFLMRTLTVHGTDLSGRPDSGGVAILVNADNPARLAASSPFRHGIAKFSVPVGHYWAIGDFSFGRQERMVFHPQFRVPASGAYPRVRLAARAATSQAKITTARPALTDMFAFTVIMQGKAGLPASFGIVADHQPDFWVSPVKIKSTVGSLRTFTQVGLASKPGPGVPYAYKLDFPGPADRVAPQRFAVRQSSLATVTNTYFQDTPSTGLWTETGGTVPEVNALVPSTLIPLPLPGRLVQYLSAGQDLLWEGLYFPLFNRRISGGQLGSPVSVTAGEQVSEDWGRYPLHPASRMSLARLAGSVSGFQVPPAAARAGDVLGLNPTLFGDNTPGHRDGPFRGDPNMKVTERFEVDQNGTKLAEGNAINGIPPVRLSGRPSVIRFTFSTARTDKDYVLSTSSTTIWTWRSRRDPAATVPEPWICQTGSPSGTGQTRHCAVQPMLMLAYQVAGLGLDGATAPGRQVIGLAVSHLPLSAGAAIKSATVQVSFDDGASWQPAQVTAGGPGQFSAVFTAPAGAFVTMRATATDQAGGSITQTIRRAYRTTPRAAVITGRSGKAEFITPPCAAAAPGQARCFLVYRPQAAVNRAMLAGQTASPHGLSARSIRSAYHLPSRKSSDQTVAVSIAFHTPGLARFLATYRRQFGLPPCTVASGCFRQVNQHGKAGPAEPSGVGTGWDLEATLDVSMISVACPRCKILVVEANSPGIADLAATEATAARLGAPVISDSYGAGENGYSLPYRRDYQQRGHTIVASSGDAGFTAAQFPADLPNVTAVGGTMLTRAPGTRRGWKETTWHQPFGAGGSGCSAWITKPSWQHDTHCPTRTIADISAVATNIPVYNSVYGGWVTLAGTSASAPLIAGIYGLAGNAAAMTTASLYKHHASFHDITTGTNSLFAPAAQACGDDYLCAAHKGYDAPTGLGTPNGTSGL